MNTFRTISPSVPLYGQVEEYLAWCKTRQSNATIKTKRWNYARLYQETGLRDLGKLTNGFLDEYLRSLMERGCGPVGLNRLMTDIKSLVQWQREMNGLEIPIKLLLLEKAPVTVREQVFYPREVIEKVIRSTTNLEVQLMIRISFDTGMRASELSRLRVKEVDGQKLTFLAKGKMLRVTFVSKKTAREIQHYVAKQGLTDYLFPGGHGGHIAYNTLRRRLTEAFYAHGYMDFHPHSLRHSFVADLERRGASTEEIQALIGHASIKSTQIYQHRIRQSAYLVELHKKYRKW